MQCWQNLLDLRVIAWRGLGKVITSEEDKTRNHSCPAHTLIIWLVRVFNCNNAWLCLSDYSSTSSTHVAAHRMHLQHSKSKSEKWIDLNIKLRVTSSPVLKLWLHFKFRRRPLLLVSPTSHFLYQLILLCKQLASWIKHKKEPQSKVLQQEPVSVWAPSPSTTYGESVDIHCSL